MYHLDSVVSFWNGFCSSISQSVNLLCLKKEQVCFYYPLFLISTGYNTEIKNKKIIFFCNRFANSLL